MTNESDGDQPQIIIYETDDKVARVSVRLDGETVWLTNLQLSQLFKVSKATVSEHIKNIFGSGELMPDSVVRNFRTPAADGKTYNMSYYNLDMIISLSEYVKYQARTLSDVEKQYLASLRSAETAVKRRNAKQPRGNRPEGQKSDE